MRRDERGLERAMVEFIGLSNAREFKARALARASKGSQIATK